MGTLAVIVLVVDLALPKETSQQNYRLVTYHAPAAFAAASVVASSGSVEVGSDMLSPSVGA